MVQKLKFDENGIPTIGKTELGNIIRLSVEDLQQVLLDGDVVEQRSFPFIFKDNKFIVEVGEDKAGKIISEIKANLTVKDAFSTGFAFGLDNILHGLSGEVTLYTAQNSPMVLEKKHDKYRLVYLIAPMVKPPQ